MCNVGAGSSECTCSTSYSGKTDSASGPSSIGAISGIVAAAVLVAGACSCLGGWWYVVSRRQKRRDEETGDEQVADSEIDGEAAPQPEGDHDVEAPQAELICDESSPGDEVHLTDVNMAVVTL